MIAPDICPENRVNSRCFVANDLLYEFSFKGDENSLDSYLLLDEKDCNVRRNGNFSSCDVSQKGRLPYA
jgi:hypothetical protein